MSHSSDFVQRAEVDVDHMSLDFARNSHEILQSMHGRCPVAWSNHHGGYWLVTDYKHVAEVARDDRRFSSVHEVADPSSPLRGVGIPEAAQHAGFIEMDPPLHTRFRKPWQSWFAPAATRRFEPRMRELARARCDDVIESGRIDLVHDYAAPVPALVVLEYLGLSTENWRETSDAIHSLLSTHPADPRFPEMVKGWHKIGAQVRVEMDDRRSRPRGDLISSMIHTEIDGEAYPEDLLHGDIMDFIAGGVDTTTALASFAFLYLGRHPDERQLLIDEPMRRDAACEEFLRYFSPITAIARTVTEDAQLGDQSLRKGERVMICFAGANLDESEFPRAEEVILDRFPNRHSAFGLGVHRCIGSNFARADFRAMLDEVLERIPDYRIEESTVQQYPAIGKVNGYLSIEATFTPRKRRRASAYSTT
jgi:cytochrome P450